MKKLKLVMFLLLGLMLVATTLVGACAEPAPVTPTAPEGEVTPTAPEREVTPTGGPVVLVFGSPMPEMHSHSVVDNAWLDKIEEESNGRVKFERYFGGSLLSSGECYAEISKGVCDLGWSYRTPKTFGYEIAAFAELAFTDVPPIFAGAIMNELRSKFPEIDAQYKDVKTLQPFTALGYSQLLTAGRPIHRIEDFNGLTINTGGARVKVLPKLGAEAVSMPIADWYSALSKGTIDGLTMFVESLKTQAFAEVVDYVNMVNLGDGPEQNRVMNWDTWNSLPADIQNVFEDNYEFPFWATKKSFDRADVEGLEFSKEYGVEVIDIAPEELERFYEFFRETQDQEAAELDAKGLPGTAILKEIHRLNEIYKVPVK